MSIESEAKRGVFFGSDLRALGVTSDYFTVIVPYVADPKIATEWHPTDPTFAPLTRGCFATMQEAIVWALDKLGTLAIDNHWYVKEITHCKRCGEYKQTHNVYCSGSCMMLAKDEG